MRVNKCTIQYNTSSRKVVQIEISVFRKKNWRGWSKTFKWLTECSSDNKDIYKSIEEYNPGKKQKVLYYLMIWLLNKTLHSVVTEFFIRCQKLIISFVFITQSYFPVPKDERISITHFLVMKIRNRQEVNKLQSFIWYRRWQMFEAIQKIYSRAILIFSHLCYSFIR